MKSLNLSATRTISTGSGVTVAVLDSGSFPHPDIRKNLLAGSDQTSSHHRDGRSDNDGHGTRMAALIAGHGRGTTRGIQGIAPSAKVLPVVITADGRGHADLMARGVAWASSQKAQIINISGVAGPGFELQDAIDEALDDDIVVVAAVGNTSSDAIINYPAAFDGVLAVGATGRDGDYSSSSVKDEKVQICAPGVDIISAQPPDRYGSATGTSDSTAIASGAAALIRAKFPNLSAKEVVHRLTATADDIGPPGRDDECGFGRLNIVKALTADVPPLEGGGNASSAPTSGASSAAGAVRPEFASPGAAAASEPASSNNGWLWGGLAGVIAAVGVVVGLVLRRRRT
ncbi:S8 family serine peptidase [Actinoplanes sp. Pm04-4]|uniref:S8 family serine peptidase n=1 Tax=Paractinoplanes pyxinae TaxID=2997416 RepID=A0ABT4B2S2_9ACTN|nr:S8 family serine peptidase [Actinoplanes pyxinae]MCY1140789.1 S8 family serine peptidase [Actinoplanes pyxinae]